LPGNGIDFAGWAAGAEESGEVKIAIVGAGISGLVTAYLLHREHEIAVFEAEEYAGGHTRTVEQESGGRRFGIDTGFVVFNHKNYPHFTALLSRLGIASRPTTMSFSLKCERTGLEYNGTSLNRTFAQRSNLVNPRFLRMLVDILRFHKDALRLLQREDEGPTIGEYLATGPYREEFASHYLLPIGSAIWSCPPGTFRQFPIRFVVEFFANHGLLQVYGRPVWRTVQGGSARYVEAMTAGFRDQIRLGSPVQVVARFPDRVWIRQRNGNAESFDEAILAVHSDQALDILADATEAERDILPAFPYQKNAIALHTDSSLLPKKRLAWAAWNYHLRRDQPDRAAVTYNMNILQGLDAADVFCVTLNDDGSVDPARVRQRFTAHHPVYTVKRAAAQPRHPEMIRRNRTSFCGAYWGAGFHEDGVRSALAVCRAYGITLT
jgi:predicted NAD/FAD-binding protein